MLFQRKKKLVKRQQTEEFLERQKGAIDKFVFYNTSSHEVPEDLSDEGHDENVENNNVENAKNTYNFEDNESPVEAQIDFYDQSNWPDNLDHKTRNLLVEKGPIRKLDLVFPLDYKSRHFS